MIRLLILNNELSRSRSDYGAVVTTIFINFPLNMHIFLHCYGMLLFSAFSSWQKDTLPHLAVHESHILRTYL